MAAFYKSLQDKETTKEEQGKLGLKIGQLDDSVAQEMKFTEFCKKLSVNNPRLWLGEDD